jgi:hypothetical protein
LHGDEWELRVVDSSDSSQQWSLADPDGPSVLPRLLERALLAQIRARTDWWKLDSSRIWYEAQPFERQDGIAAYQRFQIATLLIEGVGVGIAVDIGTAFFTLDSLAYFFDPSVSATEQARRKRQFDHLTNRQVGQKGTLLYDTGRSQTKCYFESAPHDATCAGTGSIRVRKRSYPSLLEYYRDQHPHMGVTADDIAVRVSFPGIGRPVWVAAKSLHIRVMNDQLPSSLKQVDKVAPEDRRRQVEQFWLQLGPTPLGAVAPGILPEFWRPGVDAAQVVSMPTLHFGQGRRLDAPSQRNAESYQDHYRDRATLLARAGSYSVPPAMARKLYFAYPETVSGPVRDQLAKDLSQAVSTLTGYPIDQQIITYREVSDAAVKLRSFAHAGAVVLLHLERPDTKY